MKEENFEVYLNEWNESKPLNEIGFLAGLAIPGLMYGASKIPSLWNKAKKGAIEVGYDYTKPKVIGYHTQGGQAGLNQMAQGHGQASREHQWLMDNDPTYARDPNRWIKPGEIVSGNATSGTPQVTSNGVVTPPDTSTAGRVGAATADAANNSNAIFGGSNTGGIIGGMTDAIKTGAKNVGDTLTKNKSPQVFAGTGGFTKAANAAMGAFIDFAKANPSLTAALGLFGAYKLWKNRNKDRRYYSY